MGKVGKSITKVAKKTFKSATKVVDKLGGVGNVLTGGALGLAKGVVGTVGETVSGGSGTTTTIQQTAEAAKQRYATEEGKATEQGASEFGERQVARKKIKRLTSKKG